MGASANISLNKIAQNPGLVNPFCKKNLQYLGRNCKLRRFHLDLVDHKQENRYHKATLANRLTAGFWRYINMKLGEKLQQLRKQSGLSQEQLAAQLTVSRQAVSKWELDETMPDTENVIQLSRLFGVSCDYLLREEIGEERAPLSNAPGEGHLTQQGWIRNALVLSLGLCTVGLLLALCGWFSAANTEILLAIGLSIQVLGVVLFELSTSRMAEGKTAARWRFYIIACWLMTPALLVQIFWYGFWLGPLIWMGPVSLVLYTLLIAGSATLVLQALRRKQARKK